MQPSFPACKHPLAACPPVPAPLLAFPHQHQGVLAANIFDWGAKACVDLYQSATILEMYREVGGPSTLEGWWDLGQGHAMAG